MKSTILRWLCCSLKLYIALKLIKADNNFEGFGTTFRSSAESGNAMSDRRVETFDFLRFPFGNKANSGRNELAAGLPIVRRANPATFFHPVPKPFLRFVSFRRSGRFVPDSFRRCKIPNRNATSFKRQSPKILGLRGFSLSGCPSRTFFIVATRRPAALRSLALISRFREHPLPCFSLLPLLLRFVADWR